MSNALLSSKTVVQEDQTGVRTAPSVLTAVLAMVGIAQRGPIGIAQFYDSFDAWRRDYGDVTSDTADTWNSVYAYFATGGQFLWFTRTAHYTDITDASSVTADTAEVTASTITATSAKILGVNAAPYALTSGNIISVAVDGGAAVTATFTAAASSSTSASSAPFALSNGQTLTIAIDGGAAQTVTFQTADFASIGAATAAEVAAKINSTLLGGSAVVSSNRVVIRSDRKGTSSLVNVTGGTASAAFSFPAAVAGTGNVANIAAVTFSELVTVIEAAIPGLSVAEHTPASGIPDLVSDTSGVSSSLSITASVGLQTAVGWASGLVTGSAGSPVATLKFLGKSPGTYANALQVTVSAASNGNTTEFNVVVRRNGLLMEQFPNCSMDPLATNYVVNVLARAGVGSALISAEDLAAGGSNRPMNGNYTPSGGLDGLSGLADLDFIGDATDSTGIRALDTVSDATILVIPQRATAAVANAMIDYCENVRNGGVFPIIECPAAMNAQAIVNYVKSTAGIYNTSEFGFIAWPRVKILNPNTSVFGNVPTVTIPNSGVIAGMCARTDNSRPGGIYEAPAGLPYGRMPVVVDLEDDPDGGARHQVLKESTRDYVYPANVNPITNTGNGIVLDGTRLLKSGGNFQNIAARRGVSFIEASCKLAADFARHRNNTEELRAQVERVITQFLLTQMRVGAFKTKDPKTAFFVDAGPGLNTPDVINSGQLLVRVGLNTNSTVDWVVLTFTKDTRELDQQLAVI